MRKIKLFNIQHFSLYDGPGIRTVVFFKGCPLNCVWCHNPESKSPAVELAYYKKNCRLCGACVDACPNGAHSISNGLHTICRSECKRCGKCVDNCVFSALEIMGRDFTIDEIMDEIKKDDMFFGDDGGVTISGGEPFIQFEGLYELAERVKAENYSLCIETSGFTSENKLRAVADYVDLFLYDYKLTGAEEHIKHIGKDNREIINNLSILDDMGANVVLRCPIIPGINDCEEHFRGIAEMAEKHTCILSVELMPYHPLGISKAEQIGKNMIYNEKTFLSKDKAQEYAEFINGFTSKKVFVSG